MKYSIMLQKMKILSYIYKYCYTSNYPHILSNFDVFSNTCAYLLYLENIFLSRNTKY